MRLRGMILFVMACLTTIGTQAMSYDEARREALYLTDKMAYELNLNQDQADYAYEINLDYLLGIRTASDLTGACYRHRCADLRVVFHDWQYALFLAADYFLHPVVWRHSAWHFPIYSHYAHHHFYYAPPRVYVTYRGGHGRLHHSRGFYAGRRPHWTSGLRGAHRGGPSVAHRPAPRVQARPDNGHGRGRALQAPKGNTLPRLHQSSGSATRPVVNNSRTTTPRSTTAPRSTGSSRASRSQRSTFQNSSTRSTVHRSPSAPAQRGASTPRGASNHGGRGGR